MNPIEILEQFGIPVAVACAFAWYIIQQKKSLDEQNKYIQEDLKKDLEKRFALLEKIINEDLRQIIVVLISRQKKMQIELRGIMKKYEALVEIINKLILRNDKK